MHKQDSSRIGMEQAKEAVYKHAQEAPGQPVGSLFWLLSGGMCWRLELSGEIQVLSDQLVF